MCVRHAGCSFKLGGSTSWAHGEDRISKRKLVGVPVPLQIKGAIGLGAWGDLPNGGKEEDLRWLREHLESKSLLKTQVMSEVEHVDKKMKVLNRMIGWRSRGISYEVDTQHVPAMLRV